MKASRHATGTIAAPVLLLLGALLGAASAAAAVAAVTSTPATSEAAILERIRSAAMNSDWARQHLTELTDTIGPRISGSPQLDAAISQVAAAMRALGAQVRLQPAKVPHWVRGAEQAELIEYPGRPAGLSQRLQVTALGFSAATPAEGLSARVVVVHGFDELQRRTSEIPGSIVLFDEHFDQRLAENGDAFEAYGRAVQYRSTGAAKQSQRQAAHAERHPVRRRASVRLSQGSVQARTAVQRFARHGAWVRQEREGSRRLHIPEGKHQFPTAA